MKPQILAALLLAASTVTASADDWTSCTKISFAPLDDDIPACTRLIEGGSLSNELMVTALTARAEAYLFAQTYRSNHAVERRQLAVRAAADYDRAVALIQSGDEALRIRLTKALAGRANVQWQLGNADQAARDYAEVLRSAGDVVHALYGHALAMKSLGRFKDAIADMDAVVRIAVGTSNHHNWIFTRGQMYEAAGDVKSAIEDFRRTLQADAQHIAAVEALRRLGAAP